jgi:hypothetical protein
LRAIVNSHGARAAGRVVAPRRAPDRGEDLLRRLLRAPAVAEPPEREPVHRPRVAAVELVERVAVAGGDPLHQLAVGQGLVVHAADRRPFHGRRQGESQSQLHPRCLRIG